MFKPVITLLFIACAAGSLSAQLLNFSPNAATYIFGDKVNVRAQPRTDAPAVAQLVAGDEVFVLEESAERSTLNGLDLFWYKIRFDGQKTGYIWGGLLSVWGRQSDGDVRFVAGAVQGKVPPPGEGLPTYTLEARAVRNGAVLHKVSTSVSGEGTLFAREYQAGAFGLKGYRGLLNLTLSAEACGYPWADWFVLWNGQQLVPLPVCTSVADGGVFGHTERYIFPEDDTEDDSRAGHHEGPELLYFCIEHQEREEWDDGKGWNENSWSRVRPMRWDGQKFVRPKDMGEPKE